LVKVQLGSARASSLQPGRIAPLLLAGIVAFSFGAVGNSYFPRVSEPAAVLVAATAPVVNQVIESAPAQVAVEAVNEIQNTAAAAVAAVAPKPEVVSREVEMRQGGNFARMLADADVAPEDASAVAAVLNQIYGHRKLKGGQEVMLTFSRIGAEETLIGVTFQPEATKEVSISRGINGQFAGHVETTPIERERIAARGEIRTSLYEAGAREGVPRAVVAAMIRAYSHAIDFQRDIHPGDKFEVFYDQPTAKNGKPVGQGVIIYAALEVKGKVKPLYRVTFADGAADYFDEKGQSVKRTLMRTPLDGGRVTSGFGMRMHPLLGYSKMHQGTDFGAPTGTPIFAAGGGVVEEIGHKGSYGRYIRVRHNGKIETAYAHMSRFARGLHQGARVNQGDVIGFVGSSGRSTGPHLHYEVHVNNRPVNPLSVNLPTGRVLEGKMLAQFRQGQTKIKREFASLLSRDPLAPSAQAETPATANNRVGLSGVTKVNATAPAFGNKSAKACGLRGC